jgi:hypothetical protein
MKKIYSWLQGPKKNKAKELEIYFSFLITSIFNFDFEILREYGPYYNIYINVFNIFTFNIQQTREQDHAGFYFSINLIGLNLDYSHYDIRHWDEDNDKFMTY